MSLQKYTLTKQKWAALLSKSHLLSSFRGRAWVSFCSFKCGHNHNSWIEQEQKTSSVHIHNNLLLLKYKHTLPYPPRWQNIHTSASWSFYSGNIQTELQGLSVPKSGFVTVQVFTSQPVLLSEWASPSKTDPGFLIGRWLALHWNLSYLTCI